MKEKQAKPEKQYEVLKDWPIYGQYLKKGEKLEMHPANAQTYIVQGVIKPVAPTSKKQQKETN